MFVLVSLPSFKVLMLIPHCYKQVSNFIYSYASRLPYFLLSIAAQSKSRVQKSRQSHLTVFWKFSLQNLGKYPKLLHTTSEWMNSDCHRLFSLCPLFHFYWKWGVRHSPSFVIPQLSPKWGWWVWGWGFKKAAIYLGHIKIKKKPSWSSAPSSIFGDWNIFVIFLICCVSPLHNFVSEIVVMKVKC